MNVFTISQLQQFSGVKAHTIRVWEQRYEALSPVRSEGNTRYYNDVELKRLLNIKSLLDCGYKISQVAPLSDQELGQLIGAQLPALEQKSEYFINTFTRAALEYNTRLFEKTFSQAARQFSVPELYTEIILPVMTRTGLLWACNDLDSSQEHFLSNMIRQKLYAAIDSVDLPAQPAKKWLLFLPENEFHETGLLLASYLLKQAGQEVVYLGNNVAEHALRTASQRVNPDYALLFLVHHQTPADTAAYLQLIKKIMKQVPVLVASSDHMLKSITSKGVIKLTEVNQLPTFIKSIS